MSAIQLDKITLDGGTQSRAALNQAVVDDYAQIIRDGADFPPVIVFHDGKKHWLADGFHRVAAYRAAGAMDIPADVRQGTRRDAILFSVGANATHGLPRTNADKRRAVMVLLKDKEWAEWSDREIAKQCGVGRDLVGDVRRSLSPTDSENRTFTTKHGTVAKMDTAKIGKPSEQQAEFDRQRAETASQLQPEVLAMQAAALERRQSPKPPPTPAVDNDDTEELRNIIADQADEIAELRRKVAKFDGMVVEYEQGGFENVIAGLEQRIEILSRQVERESQEKVANLRSAAYWKKKAIDAGAHDDVVIDMATGDMTRG